VKTSSTYRFLAGVLLAGLPVQASSAVGREEVVRAGPYPLSFWGRNIGEERFVAVTDRRLIADGAMATYRLEEGELTAEAAENGRRLEQRIALAPGAVVTGPHSVTDFFVLEPLALDPKEKMALISKRESNREVKDGSGDRIKAVVYRCRIRTTDDTFETRSRLDDGGVSVRITIDAPLGPVDIRLKQS
jgi:hypothetical protein